MYLLAMTGTEFLLSMVEARWASRNGNTMEMDPKAQQELEKIEQQIATLQALPGQTTKIPAPDPGTQRPHRGVTQ